MLAWGKVVSEEFVDSICAIGNYLAVSPSYLMACMAFETGETFRPDIRNAAGSGAVGLIQFMPNVAAALGTTTDELAVMSAVDQLAYVVRYFSPWAGKLHSLGDTYGAILWPAMIGKPDDYPVFRKTDPYHPKLYLQNKGLDFNDDGTITKAEIVARVQREYERGLQPRYALN